MKLIIAILPSDRVEAVQEALSEFEICLMLAYHVGDLRNPVVKSYRGSEYREARPRIRVDIALVNEHLTDDAVEAIRRAALLDGVGHFGDCNILVMPLDDARAAYVPAGVHSAMSR